MCRQTLQYPERRRTRGVECLAAIHPGLRHLCAFCPAAFRTKAACKVHESKKHGHRPRHMVSCYGTRCEACLMEHWNETRLAVHLARSPACLAAYHHAEVAMRRMFLPVFCPRPGALQCEWKALSRGGRLFARLLTRAFSALLGSLHLTAAELEPQALFFSCFALYSSNLARTDQVQASPPKNP